MSKLCRICLNRLPVEGNIKIHSDAKISEMIFLCTTITVTKGDGLPELMCPSCWKSLEKSAQFGQVARRSEKILQAAFKTTLQKLIDERIALNVLRGDDFEEENEEISEEDKEKDKTLDEKFSSAFCQIRKKEEPDVEQDPDEIKKLRTPGRETPGCFTCQFCGKVYPTLGGWKTHVRVNHNSNYRPFVCDVCGKVFKAKEGYLLHKRTAHSLSPLPRDILCDLCGKGFCTKQALRVHTRYHTDERRFACETCGHRFMTMSKLKNHALVHGGPKPFMCEICSRDFRWKGPFKIHMRTHTGEKPFNCTKCQKAFSSNTNRKTHERTCKYVNDSNENSDNSQNNDRIYRPLIGHIMDDSVS